MFHAASTGRLARLLASAQVPPAGPTDNLFLPVLTTQRDANASSLSNIVLDFWEEMENPQVEEILGRHGQDKTTVFVFAVQVGLKPGIFC